MPEEKKDIVTLEAELERLRKENDEYKIKEAQGVLGGVNEKSTVSTLRSMVDEILGPDFAICILGFGKFTTLEVKLPDSLAVKSALLDENDNGPRYPKNHPLKGQPCGDLRHCRIESEEQMRKFLELVKSEIVRRITQENKPLPLFGKDRSVKG